MQEYGDQHRPELSLPSAEELRGQVALGEMGAAGVAAAPAGSLGHLMLVSAPLMPLPCTRHAGLQMGCRGVAPCDGASSRRQLEEMATEAWCAHTLACTLTDTIADYSNILVSGQ